jgi:hypothetical protein
MGSHSLSAMLAEKEHVSAHEALNNLLTSSDLTLNYSHDQYHGTCGSTSSRAHHHLTSSDVTGMTNDKTISEASTHVLTER